VIALDILEMPPLAGVEFLHGDFREDAVLSQLEAMLGGRPVDLVLSDMAPNKSGMDAVDQPRIMYLAELAMEFADRHLGTGGDFLIKLFQGVGSTTTCANFAAATRRSRSASRRPRARRSPEVYALAQGKLAEPKR
jgi:23S rRNA (uridine2552-2'-O)-methyltransferase